MQLKLQLKGHQIIGELRLLKITSSLKLIDWRVTRSLVSYDKTHLESLDDVEIEGSPDHWWVTTWRRILRKFCTDWRVTRSLVSYDSNFFCSSSLTKNWRVTRSLVSYDVCLLPTVIGSVIEGSPDHWWVTTIKCWPIFNLHSLKGHQIIGELRRNKDKQTSRTNNWRVTRSLVSYDNNQCAVYRPVKIEGSPDHWWVTTNDLIHGTHQ